VQETEIAAETRTSNELLPYFAWTLALLSVAGSLFFSEVMELTPCVLCWYQRIAMYPLVMIIGIGIALNDGSWKRYALPLALIGLGIAVYHNLIYYGFIPEGLTPCTQGVSCSERQIEWLGFVTIPLMGLISFLTISALIVLYRPKENS
jgi:disulfide bond formation protein DsbB